MFTRHRATHCPICRQLAAENAVTCRMCLRKFHTACTEITDWEANMVWTCFECEHASNSFRHSSITNRSPNHSQSNASGTSQLNASIEEQLRVLNGRSHPNEHSSFGLGGASASETTGLIQPVINGGNPLVADDTNLPPVTQVATNSVDNFSARLSRSPPPTVNPNDWLTTGMLPQRPPILEQPTVDQPSEVNKDEEIARLRLQLEAANKRAAACVRESRELNRMINQNQQGIPSSEWIHAHMSPTRTGASRKYPPSTAGTSTKDELHSLGAQQLPRPVYTVPNQTPPKQPAVNQFPVAQPSTLLNSSALEALTAQILNQLAQQGFGINPPTSVYGQRIFNPQPENDRHQRIDATQWRDSFDPLNGIGSNRSGLNESYVTQANVPQTGTDTMSQLTALMGRKNLTKLPEFSGDEKKWAYFESVFIRTTIEGRYQEADNVARLREALKPPAHTLVQSQLMFSTSATEIMDVLRKFYGRPERVIYAHMQGLLDFKPLVSESDIRLQDFAVAVNEYVSIVKTLRRESELGNVFQMESVSSKLHHGHYKDWKRLTERNPAYTMEDFASFLMKKVQEIPPDRFRKSEPERAKPADNQMQKPKRVSVHRQASAVNSNKGNFPRRSCQLCNSEHVLWKCATFLGKDIKERYQFLREKKICSSCLASTSHQWRDCDKLRKCNLDGCLKNHHRVLHNAGRPFSAPFNSQRQGQYGNTSSASNSSSSDAVSPAIRTSYQAMNRNNIHSVTQAQQMSHTTDAVSANQLEQVPPRYFHHSINSDSSILFKIVGPITIYGPRESVDIYAYLDGGSSITLLDKSIFDQLNLTGSAQQLRLQWTKGVIREENAVKTSLTLSGSNKQKLYQVENIHAVTDLDLPTQSLDAKSLQEKYPHLRGIDLADMNNVKPMILIGLPHAKFLVGSRNRVGEDDEPVAEKTRLGWIVYGNTTQSLNVVALQHQAQPDHHPSLHSATKTDAELHDLVKGFFTTENFGVLATKRDLVNEETQRALDVMHRTLKKVDDRYEIGLLWKSDKAQLPDSLPMARKRLVNEERSLKKKGLLEWKNNHIRELVTKGYARIANSAELRKPWPRVWYCPRFVVLNPNKIPPKPRDVADIAATVQGKSLNTNLLKGPDNMTPFLRGLFKFRENSIAVSADVKEMFHQIRITEEDQQCQRFLWRDGDENRQPTVYVMQSMMFGPTCSPACAQFVKNYHAEQYRDKYPEAVEAIIKCTYVDNYFNSHPTIEEALRVSRDAIKIFADISFDLVAFESNCPELLEKLPKNSVKEKLIDLNGPEAEHLTKMLGVFYDAECDIFTFRLTSNETLERMLKNESQPTKREVLRLIMKIFDPLGMIAHFIIRGKIILQEIWREGSDWDEPIPEKQMKPWLEFIQQLRNIEKIQIPRQYAPTSPKDCRVELIVFVDASEQAFGATAFFRFVTDTDIYVAHVMAKGKVAPIKRLTTPQLELQAAVLGVRLALTIKEHHMFEIHETKFLSDSKTTLAWICTTKYNFKSFVASRVGEILDSTTRRQWFHVGTKDNVADDVTKWDDPTMGDDQSRWFKGPEFMKLPFAEWPVTAAVEESEEENQAQESTVLSHLQNKTALKRFDVLDNVSSKIKSDWPAFVRTTAYVRRAFIIKEKRPKGFISPSEFKDAQLHLFKKIQYEAFPNEVKDLAKSPNGVNTKSSIFSLSPFMSSDGVIRMSSRAQKARTSYAARNPPILPNKHELVNTLIQHYHERNFHLAEDTTIADIRETAWIIDIRTAVRKIKTNCQECKNRRVRPEMPQMGQLPTSRLDFNVKPFTHAGIDAFGPYELKFGRGRVKRYGLIFTCLTFRAVHLELLNDMSTDQCLMAVRRFLVNRGQSSHFYSDNGKNFVGAQNVLHKDLADMQEEFGESVAKKFQIHWHFIPAYSPWFGGAWERLIQSIKKCFDYLMLEESPREDVFRNALAEAQQLMNRRPLTHIPIDQEDATPLTPNTVLFGTVEEEKSWPVGVYSENDAVSKYAYRRVQFLTEKYASRWIKEYLPEINRRSKWHKKTKPVEVGDVVIVTEPNEPKNAWKKGRVSKVYPGPDRVVRAADVKLPDGSIKPRRSVGKLAILDVRREE